MASNTGHTLKAFDEELDQLRATLAEMGGMAEAAITASMQALSRRDPARLCLVAYNLGSGDLEIRGQVLSSDGRNLPGGRLALVERTATGLAGVDKLIATFQPEGLEAGSYVLQVAVTNPATGAGDISSAPFVVN